MTDPSRREVRRYLGMKDTSDPETDRMIEDCISELDSVIGPRYVYRYFDLSFREGYPVIEGHTLESRDLAKNLKGCRKAALLVCTLGAGPDRLLKKYQVISSAKAAVIQAAAAAMIEAYTDDINRMISEEAGAQGMYTRPRYSCGYGDLGLEVQKLIFRLTDPAKNAGVSLTEGLMMVPTKSVSAFIGISDTPAVCKDGCGLCTMKDTCLYRKD